MVSEKKVSIIVPNFRTLLMTELCLNNLRHYTDLNRAEVIVVDNDSQDESVEYLRHLDWITLLERKTEGESGPLMHSRALDLALSEVDSEYVLVMHTDTIVKRPDWLDFLLGKIEAEEGIAAVGSWKLENVSPIKRFFKKIEGIFRLLRRHKPLDRKHYFRSHCAMYKTEILRRCKSTFSSGDSAGIEIFNELQSKGYKLPFIESEELCKYMLHLNHATAILNPTGNARKTNDPRRREALMRQLEWLRAHDE